MREIKFEYGFESHPPLRYTLQQIEFGLDFSETGPVKYRRQYTGIKDKNAVEVYEGDIVTAKTEVNDICDVRGVVFFSEDWLEYQIEQEDCSFPVCSFGVIDFKSVEVIGNIHQNHELMQKGE